MKKHLLTTISLLLALHVKAQQLEFSKAQKLGDKVNSHAEEINPKITEDGNTLYFTRAFSEHNQGGKLAGQDIWYSQKDQQGWNTVHNLKALNNADNNAVVGFNQEADKLYLINNYSAHPRRVQGIVVTEKIADDKWSRPVQLPVLIEMQSDHYGFYLSPDETVLLISMEAAGSIGEEDLFVSFNHDGKWTEPKHMGTVINSAGFEISPFLSHDKKSLYYSSNGLGGEGDADIFSAVRLDESWTNWSEPKNLGSNINSSGFDAYFVMNDSGEAYFASNRGLATMSDLYLSQGTIVEEEKEIVDSVAVADEETMEDTVRREENVQPLPLPTDQRVYFAFERTELTEEAKTGLSEVIESVDTRTDILIEISGHADKQGSDSYNQDLSQKRATSVMTFLTARGIKDSDIKVYYFGESKLASTGSSLQDHQANRRVEITFKRK